MQILFNKLLLTTWFRYPFFLTTWHCVLGTIFTQILARTTKLLPSVEEGKVSINDYIRKILPVSFLFAYGLVAGNVAYSYISLSYIQMVKAITPVPLLLLSFAFGREKPSVAQLLIVVVVSAGVMMSSIGELKFSWIGFLIQVSLLLRCSELSRAEFSLSVLGGGDGLSAHDRAGRAAAGHQAGLPLHALLHRPALSHIHRHGVSEYLLLIIILINLLNINSVLWRSSCRHSTSRC